jgi:hypothetical protein
MSTHNIKAVVKRALDRSTYLTSDAAHEACFWESAELGGVDFSLSAYVDHEDKGTLRVHDLRFSASCNLTEHEMRTLAAALLLCADDLRDRAHMHLLEAA